VFERSSGGGGRERLGDDTTSWSSDLERDGQISVVEWISDDERPLGGWKVKERNKQGRTDYSMEFILSNV
jgi:hypothetical protein